MSDKIIENNQVTIMGEVVSGFTFSHEVCLLYTSSGYCKFAGQRADGFLLDRIGHFKIFIFQILMDPAHDSPPQAKPETGVIVTFFIVIISAPYSTGICLLYTSRCV